MCSTVMAKEMSCVARRVHILFRLGLVILYTYFFFFVPLSFRYRSVSLSVSLVTRPSDCAVPCTIKIHFLFYFLFFQIKKEALLTHVEIRVEPTHTHNLYVHVIVIKNRERENMYMYIIDIYRETLKRIGGTRSLRYLPCVGVDRHNGAGRSKAKPHILWTVIVARSPLSLSNTHESPPITIPFLLLLLLF